MKPGTSEAREPETKRNQRNLGKLRKPGRSGNSGKLRKMLLSSGLASIRMVDLEGQIPGDKRRWQTRKKRSFQGRNQPYRLSHQDQTSM